MIEKIVCTCLVCSKQFLVYPSKVEGGRGKYCSKECTRLARLGTKPWNRGFTKIDHPNLSSPKSMEFRIHMSSKMKGKRNALGYKHTREAREAISRKNMGRTNPFAYLNFGLEGRRIGIKNKNWKGNEVSYRSLHKWVERWKGKSNKCELCGKISPRLHWANMDHKYERDLVKWLRLCAPCHGKYDKIHNLRKRI
jgi:hypothetical protein